MSKKVSKTYHDLHILPLKGLVVFPHNVFPIIISHPELVKIVNDVVSADKLIGLVTQNPGESSRKKYRVGTAAKILKLSYTPDGYARLLLQGVKEFHVRRRKSLYRASVEFLELEQGDEIQIEAQSRALLNLTLQLIGQSPIIPEELRESMDLADTAEKLTNLIAANITLQIEERQKLLEATDLSHRFDLLLSLLQREIKVLEATNEAQAMLSEEIKMSEKEQLLKDHLKAVKQELGEEETGEEEWEREIGSIKRQIHKAKMPNEVHQMAMKELNRLEEMSPMAAEYPIARTYIDWLVSLPWKKESKDAIDLKRARAILDEDHHNLADVKDRILEFLAVRRLRNDSKGPILCFAGPPGVGKTSLGKSIARAMDRSFVRFSVGGLQDEAEIRGHRRTYVGAMPGRIIQMIKEAGTRNPVFMLDEIDKINSNFRGDPASALLEALDPQQNSSFADHYLDVKFDLSQVMFICTANVLHHIPPALLDRMEVIELPGYIMEDKVEIARNYLIPRQIKENGLRKKHLRFTKRAISKIIEDYTHEAGVRGLDREIATICRKTAFNVASGADVSAKIDDETIVDYLGPAKNYPELAGIKDSIGIATGLAWTPVGGEILFVEATMMKGGKKVSLTGQLGDVMQESAHTALSYLRSHADKYEIDADFFTSQDVHIHVPAGAVSKDGPSAGVTMATALLSLLRSEPVRHDVAMTGEISLRGRVLPVGGIKEKVIAARRAGIRTVVLPARNEKDLLEVPEHIRDRLKVIYVDSLDDVFKVAIRHT